jgi:hypothetical protein
MLGEARPVRTLEETPPARETWHRLPRGLDLDGGATQPARSPCDPSNKFLSSRVGLRCLLTDLPPLSL